MEIQKAILILEEFFRPVSESLDKVINPEQREEEEPAQVDPKAAAGAKGGVKKDDKKPAGKAPAKGAAKGELGVYESPLPMTSAGVETLVLMLDSRLEGLPVEALKVFSKIPNVARDFSLHMYMHRVKQVGH